MSNKSAVPVDNGFPNPFLDKAKLLISKQFELRVLVRTIQCAGEKHRTKTGFDLASLLTTLEGTDVKEKLKSFWDAMNNEIETRPVLHQPPRPKELYGRFGKGCSIFDIGSGNCSKLVSFTGTLKITACDIDFPSRPARHVMSLLEGDIKDHISDIGLSFATSFMSLCQIPADVRERICELDGMHLIPDHETLIKSGVAEQDQEHVVVRTTKGSFRDFHLEMPGYRAEVGYKICPTFALGSYDVVITPEISGGEVIHVDATPCGAEDINYHDVSWKSDGVPFELELYDGQSYLTGRNKEMKIGSNDFPGHLCVQFEDLLDFDGERRHVLIRILSYKGMVPPHCYEVLQYFCQRVKIKINGLLLEPPQRYVQGEPNLYPCDGLISRVGEKDFYHKEFWTVDLHHSHFERLGEQLGAAGFAFDSEVKEGLWEYSLKKQDSLVTLRPLKPRVDKITATSLETVMYLLNKTTLSEMTALLGYTFNCARRDMW